ncbi:DUF3027 domain-containing protein [Microbacterium sp. LRZ72]|uniref:DUF3027 domain-containing protein n=1 Tax=Microbacterium sp. LRZ72 TaxID=2942481 RepID=UPI0029AF0927|nr:DUF3027 domain-containing protein [Microbacterium sp. LRZ72]MDX2375928.1 DUF3027 domain-containing protein [Microbacterium sp. LRZ72]
MNSMPEPDRTVDPDLLGAREIALAALREITPERTIGDAAGHRVEDDGSVSLLFNNRMPGYPGWFWAVTVARVEGEPPTVLETQLQPGDAALLAPDWVPWTERLADYHAQQALQAERAASDEAGDEDAGDTDLDDVADLDAADYDTDGSPILHAGDVDGVDIDELADDGDEDEDGDDTGDEDDEDDEGSEDELVDAPR